MFNVVKLCQGKLSYANVISCTLSQPSLSQPSKLLRFSEHDLATPTRRSSSGANSPRGKGAQDRPVLSNSSNNTNLHNITSNNNNNNMSSNSSSNNISEIIEVAQASFQEVRLIRYNLICRRSCPIYHVVCQDSLHHMSGGEMVRCRSFEVVLAPFPFSH